MKITNMRYIYIRGWSVIGNWGGGEIVMGDGKGECQNYFQCPDFAGGDFMKCFQSGKKTNVNILY